MEKLSFFAPFLRKKNHTFKRKEGNMAKRTKQTTMDLSDLSDEQQKMVSLAKEGKNVLVDACIGSGKTTTIQVLCNELKDKRILYLTYNKLLKVDAKNKIKGKNVTTSNYHGFAYMCLIKAGIRSGVQELIQNFVACSSRLQFSGYDILVIDEYQDIDQQIAEMLECIKRGNPGIQIIAVGDMQQKIYDKTTLNATDFMNNFLGRYESVVFTKCFRLCAPLAAKLGRIWEKKINGVNNNCEVLFMRSYEVVDFLAEQNTADILCLGSRNGKMSRVLNKLEESHPEKFNKKTVYASISDEDSGGAVNPTKSTAIFTTYDGSKGMERKICVVFDYTFDYWDVRRRKADVKYEILRNIFCVAMSRGKEKIIIVKDRNSDILDEYTLSEPFATNRKYDAPFQVSSMFDFKYDEDIERCYRLIHKKKIKVSDKSVINVNSSDYMIDLSPCIGIYQEVSFFKNYDIDKQIRFTKAAHKDRSPLYLEPDSTLEEKVLFLTAYDTSQNRYYCQVRPPFIAEEQVAAIHDRLKTEFSEDEEVQDNFSMKLVDKEGDRYTIDGKPDVIKNNMIYELKFTSELEHKHFLQCAFYMIAFHLKKGVLWNIKTNERYIITVPNEKKFMNAVIKAITKGKTDKVSIKGCRLV